MGRFLVVAGVYHLAFAIWSICWPHLCFQWLGADQPNHPMLWRGLGLLAAVFGLAFLLASRSPIRHWPLVLIGFLKTNFVIVAFVATLAGREIPWQIGLFILLDDLVWWFPLAAILWAAAQAHAGRPPSGDPPLSIGEAASHYKLSTGETLAEASRERTLVLVFLRHFGCTFTRQILRELETLKAEADRRGARLVLVHMMAPGGEREYLSDRRDISRIADPMCELYRAFGLGKGGFLELFGPRVWWPLAAALVRGCGVGHLAGDGLQLPGAFVFRDGEILSSQRAETQVLLPDLPRLFEGLPAVGERETVAS